MELKELRISNKKRKYSPTPIVSFHKNNKGEEIETIEFVSVENKKIGDEKSKLFVKIWNEHFYNLDV